MYSPEPVGGITRLPAGLERSGGLSRGVMGVQVRPGDLGAAHDRLYYPVRAHLYCDIHTSDLLLPFCWGDCGSLGPPPDHDGL